MPRPSPSLSLSPQPSLCSPARQRVLAALGALVLWLAPTPAAAWCRASDEVGENGECIPEPDAPFLFWKRACVSYQFNRDFFGSLERLSETAIRSTFQASFDSWAAVDCDGRASFFVEQLAATTAVDKGEYRKGGPNQSVVLALDAQRWAQLPDHSERAIAITLMWHSKMTGEILDVDMELNLGAGEFDDCVANRCSAGTIDLHNTITHEAGHLLGLGHSTDASSTMAAQTVGSVETGKRSLGPDDEAGYCALMLPEWQCTNDACSCQQQAGSSSGPALQNSAGCQVALPGAHTRDWPWLWAALAFLVRGRRRRA